MKQAELIYEDELFKVVPEYENYFVSADGKVVSTAKGAARKMKIMFNDDGYAYVYMYRNKKQKKVYIHHAVLLAWVGPRPPETEGRHLNDDKTNNHYTNLAWGTRQDNVNDKVANGRQPHGETSVTAKLSEEQVIEIRHKYSKGVSCRDIGNEYGVSHHQVLKIIHGKNWKHLPCSAETISHSSKRKTPMRDFEIQRGIENLRKHTQRIKKERKMIPCACGCGTVICSVDSKGRDIKYVQGHNLRHKKGM